jgi:GGDEF domain-containing protein
MDSTVAKFQALRLQRIYLLAQLNYAITYVVIGVACMVGQYNASGVISASHVMLGVTLQAIIFGMIKSGINSTTGEKLHCTPSAGLNLVGFDENLEDRLKQADEALYRAKETGRNRCEVFEGAYA